MSDVPIGTFGGILGGMIALAFFAGWASEFWRGPEWWRFPTAFTVGVLVYILCLGTGIAIDFRRSR